MHGESNIKNVYNELPAVTNVQKTQMTPNLTHALMRHAAC
jgi:hypothetical protein